MIFFAALRMTPGEGLAMTGEMTQRRDLDNLNFDIVWGLKIGISNLAGT
jgi:hypothetical protein